MINTNTSTQLMDIATRIRGMRGILGYSMQKMAEQTEVTEEIYHQYESGTVDLPFTFLHKCAKVFGVEITVLLEGQSAKRSRVPAWKVCCRSLSRLGKTEQLIFDIAEKL